MRIFCLISFGNEASWCSQVRARAEWKINGEDFYNFLAIYLPSVGEQYFILWWSSIFFRFEKTKIRLLVLICVFVFTCFLWFVTGVSVGCSDVLRRTYHVWDWKKCFARDSLLFLTSLWKPEELSSASFPIKLCLLVASPVLNTRLPRAIPLFFF